MLYINQLKFIAMYEHLHMSTVVIPFIYVEIMGRSYTSLTITSFPLISRHKELEAAAAISKLGGNSSLGLCSQWYSASKKSF